MKHRLQRTLDEHQAAGRSYDWVLLLGGINDLAGNAAYTQGVGVWGPSRLSQGEC